VLSEVVVAVNGLGCARAFDLKSVFLVVEVGKRKENVQDGC